MSEREGYREVDHSGDVGIEAWGGSLSELFENATRGLLSLMSRPGAPAGRAERELAARAPAPADLLVDWLGEVILAAAIHAEVYTEVRIDSCDDHNARGVVRGAPVDPDGDHLRFDVKAATYHDLVFEHVGGRYHARVIFDL